MNPENFLFVEKYRPQTVDECILPPDIKSIFQGIINEGAEKFPNMLFVGPAGVGKTTVARALATQLGMTFDLINASEENGIDVLRTKIKRFATTRSLKGGMKLIILDEADHLSHAAQPALRGLIEQHSANCRFILTCNYPNKIIEPIISRCPRVDFKISDSDRMDISIQMFERVKMILEKENISCDNDGVIVQVISRYFPDMRKILGKIQQHSKDGRLDPSIVSQTESATFDSLMGILKDKKFNDLRKWVSENSDIDSQMFFSDFHKYLWMLVEDDKLPITRQSLAMMIPVIQQHAYQSNFIADNQIVLMAFLSTFMIEVEFV